MKRKLLTLFLIISSFFAFSQTALVNQYHFNYLAFNPALAGENAPFTLKGMLGNQFNGTTRFNQVNQVLVLDGQLYNKAGLAFQGYRSNVGNIISTGLGFSYSRGFEMGDLKLKVGANSGIFIQPNMLSLSVNQQVSPYLGVGVFASYKGVFLGVSNPMLVASNRIFEQKPYYINLGYLYESESALSFNANTLVYFDPNIQKNNIDFNLKASYNKRLGVGASYRMNKIYSYYDKPNVLIPFAEYKVSKYMWLGLSYNSNTVALAGTGASSIKSTGVFQFLIKYNNDDTGGDSWFFNKL